MVTSDWQSDLRKRGYRLTPQRQLVLEAVDKLEHATPDAILTEVRRTAGGVNISTVYRTLELLEELELVSHAHLGHGAPTYHLADRHHHLHLVCRDCGEVIEADVSVASAFADRLRDGFGFETDLKHFAIFGRCRDCAAMTAPADTGHNAGRGTGHDAGRETGHDVVRGAGHDAGRDAGHGAGPETDDGTDRAMHDGAAGAADEPTTGP